MSIKFIDQIDIKNKRVFIRVDFNVPLKNGDIQSDARIKAALPTIEYAIKEGAKIILASHLGRPKGKVVATMSLRPVGERLQFYLKKPIIFSEDCEATGNIKMAADLEPGGVMLLENLRFHPGEKKNSEHFANQLSKLCDVYIDDAFGAVHRAHASVALLPSMVQECGGGFLIQRETKALSYLLSEPKQPYTVVLGGAKISDKIDLISNLLHRVQYMLIGGAMAYTFLKAQGHKVGKSLVEDSKIKLAKNILVNAKKHEVKILLPTDHVIAEELNSDAPTEITSGDEIPDGWMGLDIGPKTVERFSNVISKSKTVMWNGPMGAFEHKPFSEGTRKIGVAIGKCDGFTVVGGGDSVAAIQDFKLHYTYTHVSTGGGALLEYLEGKTLPGLRAIEG